MSVTPGTSRLHLDALILAAAVAVWLLVVFGLWLLLPLWLQFPDTIGAWLWYALGWLGAAAIASVPVVVYRETVHPRGNS